MSGPADLAFVGGGVYTVDAARPWVEAVAVRGSRIVAAGTDAEVREASGPATDVVDLSGRLLLPGFQDAHIHASAGGLNRTRVDLSESHARADYDRIVASYARANPAAEWILGAGWSLDLFDGGIPTREQLDAVVSDRTLVSDRFWSSTGFERPEWPELVSELAREAKIYGGIANALRRTAKTPRDRYVLEISVHSVSFHWTGLSGPRSSRRRSPKS